MPRPRTNPTTSRAGCSPPGSRSELAKGCGSRRRGAPREGRSVTTHPLPAESTSHAHRCVLSRFVWRHAVDGSAGVAQARHTKVECRGGVHGFQRPCRTEGGQRPARSPIGCVPGRRERPGFMMAMPGRGSLEVSPRQVLASARSARTQVFETTRPDGSAGHDGPTRRRHGAPRPPGHEVHVPAEASCLVLACSGVLPRR